LSNTLHKKIAIMQPTYLPWIGYFAMISQADVFVFLDSVEFSYRSWQRFNRIKTRQGISKISLSVNKKEVNHKAISEVKLSNTTDWRTKNLNLLKENYNKAPYYDEVIELIATAFSENTELLSALNIKIIKSVCKYMGLETEGKFVLSSQLNAKGNKSALLKDIVLELEGTEYISAKGSFEYIETEGILTSTPFKLSFFDYNHPEYKQQFGDFESHLSILDLLFNHGKESLDILNSGLKENLSFEALKKIYNESN